MRFLRRGSERCYGKLDAGILGIRFRGQNASGVWQRFEYDAAGRLKKVLDDSSNLIETYTYGATRERLMTETSSGRTYYVWGGQSVIAEYTETGSGTIPTFSKSYVYAGSRLLMISYSSGVNEFHHPDRIGTQLVTFGGSIGTVRQSTYPFGTLEQGPQSNQVFTSYDRSTNTGLDYAVNRTYSSGQSRFTQVDPIGMAAASIGNPQSNNMYAYVQNMPTDFVDPSGLNAVGGDTRFGGGILWTLWYGNNVDGWEMRRQWFEPYPGGGSSDSGGSSEANPPPSPLCDRLAKQLNNYLSFFDELWKASGSGTDNPRERGGVIGMGRTNVGGYQEPSSSTYGGITYEGSMGLGFAPWVRQQANSGIMEILFWVHTHPNGVMRPSGPIANRSSGDTGTVEGLRIEGIIVTANRLGVFNNVGLYCNFSRDSSGLK